MTGEISLRGRVLAIGGLKEKTMAALSYGVRDVLIPEDNMRNIDELDKAVIEGLNFIPCRNVGDVLRNALVKTAPSVKRTEAQESEQRFDPPCVRPEAGVGARCDKA